LVVDDYDEALQFFVGILGFEFIEDSPAGTQDGRAKRWVVVRPARAATGLVLAESDSDAQRAVVEQQTGGRVGFFLRVDDFAAMHARMVLAGVEFEAQPRVEVHGQVAVFRDVAGNRWDLL
jgi:catechol 2,3-dioxygenase-like lactoylglutathione lyase family enzyme